MFRSGTMRRPGSPRQDSGLSARLWKLRNNPYGWRMSRRRKRATKGDHPMIAEFYPILVMIALSAFALVLLGVSIQDALTRR